MNNISVIYEYDRILDKLSDDIKSSNYKAQYFMDLLGLKRGFFYKKIKEKRFTSEEMKIISQYLYPKQFEEYQDSTIIRILDKSKEQILKGDTVDFQKTLKDTRLKYGI